MAVRLGVDPHRANQMVRGVVTLPHGTGKVTRVLVLCTPDKEAEAQEAGADFVGLDDYIEKIKGGWTDVDVIICTPSVMAKSWCYRSYWVPAAMPESQSRYGYNGCRKGSSGSESR